ncbi:phage baseplate protein [Acinetobacter sp. CFCC 10889]|uniref:phage baseplate protein n=1 Tax=Acinetobacter sp. CFCC 10889 TaxID=1775557 RepID=UPI000DD00953|nr:hypothetical protein [Acinetobacter sp. CFCC 10889]
MRTIIIDEADALFGQITNIFDSPTRTIIGMVNDLGIGADLQTIINAFNDLENKYDELLERINILEEKLKNFDGDKALVRINQVVMVDASVSDMTAFMGYGAWELYGRGRFPFCAGTILDENGKAKTIQVGETGGEAFVALKGENNGPHSHPLNLKTSIVGRKNIEFFPLFPEPGDNKMTTGESGEGKPHNNMPPFIAMQFWKRVG